MAGTDDACVHRDLLVGAHRAHGLLLDGAQQLDLGSQGQVRDLVEEQGPAVGGLKEPDLVGNGPGEAALAMPEQFALHQVLGDGPAVDRDEGIVGPGALGVDQSRG